MGLGAKRSELMPHHYPWSHIHLPVRNRFCPGEFDWGNKLLSWVCCMLSNTWATESKLKDNIRRRCFLSYFKLCLKFYFYFLNLLSFYLKVSLNIYYVFCCYHIIGFLSLGTSGSLFLGASFGALFILFHFFFFRSFFLPLWFVLCNSVFYFISLFILFYYYW